MGRGHEVRGGSLTLGIQHYPHGQGNDVVESMNAIGHGKESLWGGLVKFFQCGRHTLWSQYESERSD